MIRLSTGETLFVAAALVFLGGLPLHSATKPPESEAPALEEGAAAFAKGDLDAARRRFGEVLADQAAPAFVRGLALFGLSEVELARTNSAAAVQLWRGIASDASLPLGQRQVAQRRIMELERSLKGLPPRDPAAYRATLPQMPDPAVVFHVAPGGSDANDGSEDKPFATLAKARDAVRAFKKSRGGALPKGGVAVLVSAGLFPVRNTLTLTAEDSGTADAPVVYRAEAGALPVFTAGTVVRGWKPVADANLFAKLAPAVRGKVLEADLKANGLEDWGDATDLKRRPELFVNGAPQTLARWPNEGFVKTGEILGQDTFKVWGTISGCKDGKFRFEEERPKTWIDEPDVRLYGYWFWDWYEEYQKVAIIDAEQGSFTLSKPYSNYGYRKGQRYFGVNIFRELDQPGEWYLDRRAGKLYWLPGEGTDVAKAEIILSGYAEPFVTMQEVRHVYVLGLTFQDGRGDGLHIRGGADCLVAGCTLRRFGGDAIVVNGGVRHGIFGCAMHTLGHGAMRVAGGDRQNLSPGGHFVENCTVWDISRLKRTYAPAVHLDGCGNRVAHNRFERIPSSAMRIEGNDHLIELNDIRYVVHESDDQGGIDMFGNPLYREVTIRWNRWIDITGGTECGAAGIRLDDMITGITVQGNIFERCGAVQFGGVQIHGGKENLVDGNVFVNCHAGLSFSRWDEARWLKSIEPFLAQAGKEPYSTHYPGLAHLKSAPNVNFISRNLVLGCKNVYLRDGSVQKSVLNLVSDQPIDLGALDSGENARLRGLLFEPIPVSEIGPYPHSWRAVGSERN